MITKQVRTVFGDNHKVMILEDGLDMDILHKNYAGEPVGIQGKPQMDRTTLKFK